MTGRPTPATTPSLSRGRHLPQLPSRVLLLPLLLALLTGSAACRRPAASHAPRAISPQSTAAVMPLDAVFESPTYAYSLRYNHAWGVQQRPSQAGPLDSFTLPEATLAVVAIQLQPGTTLEQYTRSTFESYQGLHLQGLERIGSIDIGGGPGELLRATTYLTPEGLTVAAPPSPGARPRTLLQALYIVAGRGYTFSLSWPQESKTDYLALFRSILRTFTLSGAS